LEIVEKKSSGLATTDAIILVGHGAPASDTPNDLITELKRLQVQRHQQEMLKIMPREAALDKLIRERARTLETDPYKFGLERLAKKLTQKLGKQRLIVAYNEFCSPSVEEAINRLVADGAKHIVLMPTMFTPGGAHSEIEIPEIIEKMCEQHCGITLEYAWPVDLDHLANFIVGHLTNSL